MTSRPKQYLSKPWSLGARDIVEPRQPLVQISIVAVDEIQNAAVVAKDALEEQLGLAPHRPAQIFVEIRKSLSVGRHRLELTYLKPLAAKVVDQSLRFRVKKHSAYF